MVACEQRPASLTLLGKAPEVFDLPAAPLPKVCTAQALTVPPDMLARAQRHPAPVRLDGLVRQLPPPPAPCRGRQRPGEAPGARPSRTRPHPGRGRAKFSLLAAFCVAAANLRFTDTWTVQQQAWTTRRDAHAARRPVRRSRRTEPGLAELAGHPVRPGGRTGPRAPART